MKKNMKKLALLSVLVGAGVSACPFTMVNDGDKTMLVVDVQNKQAVRIKPGRSANIDPTLRGWRRFVRHETLDIYLERTGQKNKFDRHYRFVEKYCTVGAAENKISLNDIKKIARKPTDRMQVQVFSAALKNCP